MKKYFSLILLVVVLFTQVQSAGGSVGSSVVKSLVKRVSKYLEKAETREFIKAGGRRALRETIEIAEKKGGKEIAERTALLIEKYGSRTIRALRTNPEVFVPAIEKLPPTLARRAIDVVNRSPETALKLIQTYGDDALEVLARHRGTGELIIKQYGKEGIELGKILPEKLGVALVRAGKDIKKLSSKTRKKVIEAIKNAPEKIAEFIEKHPKATILAAVAYYFPELTKVVVHETGRTMTELIAGTHTTHIEYTTPDGKKVDEERREGLLELKNLGIIGYVVLAIAGVILIYSLLKIFFLLRNAITGVKGRSKDDRSSTKTVHT